MFVQWIWNQSFTDEKKISFGECCCNFKCDIILDVFHLLGIHSSSLANQALNTRHSTDTIQIQYQEYLVLGSKFITVGNKTQHCVSVNVGWVFICALLPFGFKIIFAVIYYISTIFCGNVIFEDFNNPLKLLYVKIL